VAPEKSHREWHPSGEEGRTFAFAKKKKDSSPAWSREKGARLVTAMAGRMNREDAGRSHPH